MPCTCDIIVILQTRSAQWYVLTALQAYSAGSSGTCNIDRTGFVVGLYAASTQSMC